MTDTATSPEPAAPAAPATSGGSAPQRGGLDTFQAYLEQRDSGQSSTRGRESRRAEPPTEPESTSMVASEDGPAIQAEVIDEPPPGLEGEQPEPEAAAPQALADAELLAKAREWEQSDTIPEEFHDRLVRQKINGQEKWVPLRDAVENGMMLSDYSRGWTEMRQREQQFSAIEQQRAQHFEQIRDPDQFLQAYEDMGYDGVLEQVAIRIANRRIAEAQHVNAAGLLTMRRLGLQDPNHHEVRRAMEIAQQEIVRGRQRDREWRSQQQQIQQLSQQRQVEDHHQDLQRRMVTIGNQLNQLRPLAFRAYGIHDNPQNQHRFIGHLGAYVATLQGWDGEYSREHCLAAARILSEELAHARSLPPPKETRPRALPPTRLGARPAAPGSNGGQKRGSWQDFQKQYMDR